METIIVIVALMASLVYNMKQYKIIKKCGCMDKPKKKTAYKKSWNNGGKAAKKWSNDK
jgi:hypothetical protein